MANPRESELHYLLGDTLPGPGEALDLAPSVRWVRMGLPFALDHINLWLLRDHLDGRDGWTIVDCGIASDDTRANWERVFAERLDGLPVLRVIATHFHPDHLGLAHWLTERWGCRLWMSATDFNLARLASSSTVGMGGAAAAAFFGSHGLTDPESLQKIRERADYYPKMVPVVPASFRRVMDGTEVEIGGRTWYCVAGYGHAPEHISLFCPDADGAPLLISGDMVLPRISTNVSVVDVEPEADPLTLYLNSLARYLALPANTRVLPSHGKPFTGLHERIDQLREHHDERLSEVMVACTAEPTHAAGLLSVLFKRKLDLHQTTFAMGEAIAHLNALWLQGDLVRELGADGVYRFRPA
ncbi:MBL fold metallo-hydrolase [Roseateles puraquae]|uniref:Zn-dependent hydrolase n=1 Tax=Roseateles puraquae TaxID=431059 RepID=A0A254N305_9BURK|nr:MBL fold metallo-hydrolase [Roseateles puraquae]MDG0856127.1 MBL fold metallo-hydrolase [Roseateles puraquae]OWR00520.1 Zn-dependent hydrolase [Roseateles puraquae]